MRGEQVKEVGTVLLPYAKGVCGKLHPITLEVTFDYAEYDDGLEVYLKSLTATYLSGRIEDWSYLLEDEEGSVDSIDIYMAVLDNKDAWNKGQPWW